MRGPGGWACLAGRARTHARLRGACAGGTRDGTGARELRDRGRLTYWVVFSFLNVLEYFTNWILSLYARGTRARATGQHGDSHAAAYPPRAPDTATSACLSTSL